MSTFSLFLANPAKIIHSVLCRAAGAMRMGGMGMCDGGAGKPCSNRRAGDFFEQSADLRRCESQAGTKICKYIF